MYVVVRHGTAVSDFQLQRWRVETRRKIVTVYDYSPSAKIFLTKNTSESKLRTNYDDARNTWPWVGQTYYRIYHEHIVLKCVLKYTVYTVLEMCNNNAKNIIQTSCDCTQRRGKTFIRFIISKR